MTPRAPRRMGLFKDRTLGVRRCVSWRRVASACREMDRGEGNIVRGSECVGQFTKVARDDDAVVGSRAHSQPRVTGHSHDWVLCRGVRARFARPRRDTKSRVGRTCTIRAAAAWCVPVALARARASVGAVPRTVCPCACIFTGAREKAPATRTLGRPTIGRCLVPATCGWIRARTKSCGTRACARRASSKAYVREGARVLNARGLRPIPYTLGPARKSNLVDRIFERGRSTAKRFPDVGTRPSAG